MPQGFISDTKESLDKYKKEFSGYWNEILGGGSEDFEINESTSEFEEE